ncbi:MAG TPA: DUF6600 domain-containing protein [Rhodocyclaceae bacterium]|nr:DUF6600 domain-containing protein [Rhodocyclaceae bacterium]
MFSNGKSLNYIIASILSLLLTVLFTLVAHAQTETDSDPSSRVARIDYVDGTATYAPAGTDDWLDADLNRPLTIGDRVWVENGGRAELHVGATAIRLGSATDLEILDLSDDAMQLKITQGSFNIRVRTLENGETAEIDTPNLAFAISAPGEYRIDVEPDRDTTAISVRSGSGVVYGNENDRSVDIASGQVTEFSGTDLQQTYASGISPRDDFDRWAAARDTSEDNSLSARYVSRDMTGYEDLDGDGDWSDEPGYGTVWIPRVVVANWAPYQFGHWAWIAPWGWTWVDDERWGFAPFHYGRWAYLRNRWCWVPGRRVERPVYAPALVGFIGGNSSEANWGVSLSAGLPGVAWFPLAPGEAYHPAYTRNAAYIAHINRTVVVHDTITNVYINQRIPHAITAVAASDFVQGRPVHAASQSVRPERLKEFSTMPVASSLPVAPVRQSLTGTDRVTRAAPPDRALHHDVIVRRQAPEAPVFHDRLANEFASLHGAVPGAGPVFVPAARPAISVTPRPAMTTVPHRDSLPQNAAPIDRSEINERARQRFDDRVAHPSVTRPGPIPNIPSVQVAPPPREFINPPRTERRPERDQMQNRNTIREQNNIPRQVPQVVAPPPARPAAEEHHTEPAPGNQNDKDGEKQKTETRGGRPRNRDFHDSDANPHR